MHFERLLRLYMPYIMWITLVTVMATELHSARSSLASGAKEDKDQNLSHLKTYLADDTPRVPHHDAPH